MKHLSLFSGYEGLGMAVNAVFGSKTVAVSDIDSGACKVLAHRYPGVPNLGDITTVDWSAWTDVDIVSGGSPCQDLSHAGKRGGMTEGTRSNLWVAMREAIAAVRPKFVIWENVRGAYSAAAEGGPHDHELCLCGGTDRRGGLRASRHPEADLSGPSVGGDGGAGATSADRSTRPVRRDASSASQGDRPMGSGIHARAHGRSGSFASDGDPAALEIEGSAGRSGAGSGGNPLVTSGLPLGPNMDTGGARPLRGDQAADARVEQEGPSCACPDCGGCIDAPGCKVEPCPGCMGGAGDGQPSLRALGRVLGDLSDLGYDASWHGLRAADVGAPHGRFRVFVLARLADAAHDDGNGRAGARASGRRAGIPAALAADVRHQRARGARDGRPGPEDRSLATADTARDGRHEGWTKPARLVGGPDAAERGDAVADTGGRRREWGPDLVGDGWDTSVGCEVVGDAGDGAVAWGQYAPAINRWKNALGRHAPAPTEPGRHGQPRLSPRFTEWMMGLPAGWITDVPGVTRNEALRLCGNGVVPQQAEAALRRMLGAQAVAA